MLKAIKVRLSQGWQYVPDLRAAQPKGFRGMPVVGRQACEAGCRACLDVCPADAVALDPVRIDLGRCTLCGECAPVCGAGKLSLGAEHRIGSSTRAGLVVGAEEPGPPAVAISEALRRTFGRSLKLRSVSTGGCNGCELELNATSNVNFDLGRYGIELVASPRHADGLVLSGPLTRNMKEALDLAWAAMPEPRFVVAFGACAISGGPYAASGALDRRFLDANVPAVYVPGCPPHPLTFACAILDLLGIDAPEARPPGRRQWTAPEPLPGHVGFPPESVESRRAAAERLAGAVGCDLGLGPDHRTPEERRASFAMLEGRGSGATPAGPGPGADAPATPSPAEGPRVAPRR
jgi:Ni,Fe-hydrogenase III small subunit/NAD-dependent dihydropyrimidine dehydrogenase PreA subunit